MSDEKRYPVSQEAANHALLNRSRYDALYRRSVEDLGGFWAEQADKSVTWIHKWNRVLDCDFDKGHIRRFGCDHLGGPFGGGKMVADRPTLS
ncbi:MAG: acetyl-coenzyme A synthetase N-terminal domain-containing protein [Gammaproteobacteria bacterium]